MNIFRKSNPKRKKEEGGLGEFISTFVWAMVLAFILRTFLFQPFHIPSNSMQPNLTKGDYIITSKFSLGFGRHAARPFPFPVKRGRLFERKPNRGDIIVFRPEGLDRNLVKRLAGLPGDQIQMISGALHINNVRVPLESFGSEKRLDTYGTLRDTDVQKETLPGAKQIKIYDALKNSEADNTSVFTVPAGHYFFLGDNRDNSIDSRYGVAQGGAGYVPAENLMGKAEFVLLSVTDEFALFKPWTWANMRGDRFFKGLN
jgi:signal peptidase I